MPKICEMKGVRGGDTGFPVELVHEGDRLAIRAVNEGGFACTDLDILDLIDWLHRICPEGVNVDAVARALSVLAARSSSS
jgi:hypothetical protein